MSHGTAPPYGHDPRRDIPEIPDPPLAHYRTFAFQIAWGLKQADNAEKEFVAFEELRLHPPGRERHSHHDPRVRREHARILRHIRNIHLRAAHIRSVFAQLDQANIQHKRWLYHFFSATGQWQEGRHYKPEDTHTVFWLLDEEFVTPEGIPDPRLTIEEAREWLPSTYELDYAAQLELVISAGGLASLTLEDELTAPYDAGNPDQGGFNIDRKATIKAARDRVARYLDHYQRERKKNGTLPQLYDELAWGHDTRIKALKLLIQDGTEFIALTPEFDPDTLEYTTAQELRGARINEIDYFDPLMTYVSNVNIVRPTDGAGALTVTVTANDGVAKRVYTISPQAQGD